MTAPRLRLAGLSIVELLVSLAVVSMVMAGVLSFLIAHRRVTTQEEISADLEANLRIGMRRLSESLRASGYGVPSGNLGAWIPWVTGFTTNPRVIAGGTATTPDILQTASCTTQPVARLVVQANPGDTGLTVDSTAALDTGNRRLITIGLLESAHVTNVGSATTVTIDTNPTTAGLQGLTRTYFVGTPICRVDVETYRVVTSTRRLWLNRYDANGDRILLDGIENLKIATPTGGAPNTYVIALTARSELRDPETNTFPIRRMSSAITLRAP